MDEQANDGIGVELVDFVVGRERDVNVVADPLDVEDHALRSRAPNLAVKKADHDRGLGA